jgi:sugar/nucleoside kinase (ribokinase family)
VTVLVVGDVVTDVLAVHSGGLAPGSDVPARIRVGGGGSAANTACWLASLGVPVTLVAVVGADAAGADRVAELAGAGVRCAVRRCPSAATGSVVVLSADGERTMLADRGANLMLEPSDVDSALAGQFRHLHLSGYTLLDGASRAAGRYALAAAARRGLTTSVDAASAAPLRGLAFLDWVRGTDLLLANLDEAGTLLDRDAEPAALARELVAAAGVAHAVVKCGAAGAVWAPAGGRVYAVPAVPAEVVDPTGAGDAFGAGLLAARLAGAAPQAALRAGAELGARAVARVGARPT